jgi:hypothetical protein
MLFEVLLLGEHALHGFTNRDRAMPTASRLFLLRISGQKGQPW